MGQSSIFEFMYDAYKITKPVRIIELFAGYGSQHLALTYLGVDVKGHKIVEWAVPSIQAYKDLHYGDVNTDHTKELTDDEIINELLNYGISANYNEPMTKAQIERKGSQWCRNVYNNIKNTNNLVNISNVKATDLEITETDKYDYIMTYSFPCFTADTMVLTENGNKPIIDVRIGEKVLTHNNTYQKVMANMYQGEKEIYKINSYATPNLKTTENHKFYVRELYREWDDSIRRYVRKFSEPKWVELRHITKQHYFGIAINQENNHDIHSNEFWWVMGRYIADGWKRTQGGIVIATNESKLGLLQEKIKKAGYNYNTVKQRTTYKVHIPTKELSEFVSQFGYYAHGKHLSKQVLDLPIEKLEHFIEGYLSGDGSKIGDYYKASSVSEQLIYDLGQVVAKVYRQPYRIYKTKRAETSIIEGRTVKQKDTYQIVFKKETKKQDKAFYENGYIWLPFNTIEKVGVEKVYDLTVKNNHSFMANGIIAHNCQDLSLAGKRLGMDEDSGTRSGLLWEVERILKELNELGGGSLPQVLLMENVPQVMAQDNLQNMEKWDAFLSKLGYKSYIKNLIATDYGIPQIRNRTFMISILGDYSYTFPKPIPLELKLSDMLEDDVDEKYFLSDKMTAFFEENSRKNEIKGNGFRFKPHDENSKYAYTITTRAGGRMDDNFILVPEKTKKGYAEATNGDGVYINRPHQKRGVVQKGKIQTIKTSCDDIGVVVSDNRNAKQILCDNLLKLPEIEPGDVVKHSFTSQISSGNKKAIETKNIMPTMTTRLDTLGVVVNDEKFNNLRIRKITPLEAFRLMGVKDDDYYKIAKNQSNSSLYHLAGDSIVVNVLIAIFKQLL